MLNIRLFFPAISCLIVLLVTNVAHAQIEMPTDDDLAALDEWVPGFLNDNYIPGALVALASGGEVIVSRSYGLADLEHRVPVTDSTVFEIGSISKQFVSAAVMLLVEENALDLDDQIHEYLPELPSEWYGATIRHLLTHTSGIPDYEEIGTYDTYQFRLTPEEIIRVAHSRPMDFEPGTGWYYSNTGYFLLSRIVERIEGRPINAVLTTRIFEPLGMTQTRMANPELIIPNRAAGYWVNKNNDIINRWATEPSSTLAAGGLLSSIRDLALWDDSLSKDELLSNDSKEAMWTAGGGVPDNPMSVERGYGFGWFVGPLGGLAGQYHSGQVAGFVSYFARFPEQKVSVIIFTNRYRANGRVLLTRVLETFIPSYDSETR